MHNPARLVHFRAQVNLTEQSSTRSPGVFVRIGRSKHVGYVIAPDGHWLWQAGLDDNGYGQAFSRRRGRPAKAHQVVWELSRGPIPKDRELDHVCKVRHCVNPEHLELVTHAENQRRTRLVACRRGHAFTPENTYTSRGKRWCIECRRLRDAGLLTDRTRG